MRRSRTGFSAQRDLALAKPLKKWSHVILCISQLDHSYSCSIPCHVYVQLTVFIATRFLFSRLTRRHSFPMLFMQFDFSVHTSSSHFISSCFQSKLFLSENIIKKEVRLIKVKVIVRELGGSE